LPAQKADQDADHVRSHYPTFSMTKPTFGLRLLKGTTMPGPDPDGLDIEEYEDGSFVLTQ
jgi:hypothetical protein